MDLRLWQTVLAPSQHDPLENSNRIAMPSKTSAAALPFRPSVPGHPQQMEKRPTGFRSAQAGADLATVWDCAARGLGNPLRQLVRRCYSLCDFRSAGSGRINRIGSK